MRIKRLISIVCVLGLFTVAEYRTQVIASVGANAALEEIIKGGSDGENSEMSETTPEGMSKLPESFTCSFVVPEGFKTSGDPGVYVNEFYPLESANVTYAVTKIPEKKVLTNAQRTAGEMEDDNVEYRYDELTADMYESAQKANYESLYGENIGFTLEAFESREYGGFPGYMIRTSFTPENSQTIHQVTVMVLSKNKVYTIVYSRAEDDDFEDEIAESISTIHVISKN